MLHGKFSQSKSQYPVGEQWFRCGAIYPLYGYTAHGVHTQANLSNILHNLSDSTKCWPVLFCFYYMNSTPIYKFTPILEILHKPKLWGLWHIVCCSGFIEEPLYHVQEINQCTVISASSVTSTLNTALNELYLLMRSLDLNQISPDLDVGQIYYCLRFGEDLSCASKCLAHLLQCWAYIPSKYHSAQIGHMCVLLILIQQRPVHN